MFTHKINYTNACVEFPLREIAKYFNDRPREVIGSYLYFFLDKNDYNFFAELCILEYVEKNI